MRPLLWFVLPALASSSSLDKPRTGFLQDVLSSSKAADQQYCKPTGQIQDACCDFETIESVNRDLFDRLHGLVATPYFRYHKVDLYKECPFWQEEGSCMNRACGVETTEEDHLPEAWRSYTLGKLNQPNDSRAASPAGCTEIKDSEFCVLEDELDSEGVYVDLIANPERFTGYAGASSTRVWKAIYEENCFTPVPFIDPSRSTFELGGTGFAPVSSSPFGLGAASSNNGPAGFGLSQGSWGESEKRLVQSLAGPRDAGEEVCLEKRVFYRVISGLHASISVHICDDYLDQNTGEWAPNLDCFITRIGQHPERLENMYFTYVLLLRALSTSGETLIETLQETTTGGDEALATLNDLKGLVQLANGCGSTFDETSMFVGHEAQILKTEFKEHFRNVSRIMDCVGCDKCRLWGKMQITGLGTALKLLFSEPRTLNSFDSKTKETTQGRVVLSRSEVVAFVNTLHRLSESLAAVDKFRELWWARNRPESKSEPAHDRRPPIQDSSAVTSITQEPDEDQVLPRVSEDTLTAMNFSTLPLTCAKAIWTKLIDWCEFAKSHISSEPSMVKIRTRGGEL
ncbi:ER oxidoreductin [Sporobolomyces koalae]|uniref:ER oxidoreductin n=1 Tax=Sporobolomyces koalae TaxID=500713 RepID=UPI00316E6D35